MPVRLLNSRVLKWPDADSVREAVRRWADEVAGRNADVVAIGYVGSYARGDWGVGSDVDIVILLRECPMSWVQRSARWDTSQLPVPADVLVYSLDEWRALDVRGRFGKALREEVIWMHGRPEAA